MPRLTGYLLSALFTALSVTFAVMACAPNGLVINQPMMNMAALLLVPAAIAALSAALLTE